MAVATCIRGREYLNQKILTSTPKVFKKKHQFEDKNARMTDEKSHPQKFNLATLNHVPKVKDLDFLECQL